MTGLWRLWPLHVNKYSFGMSHLVLISWFLSGTLKLMECFLWNEIQPSYISFPKWTMSCSCLRFRSSGNIMSTETSFWSECFSELLNEFHLPFWCMHINPHWLPKKCATRCDAPIFFLYLLECVWLNTPSLFAGGHQKVWFKGQNDWHLFLYINVDQNITDFMFNVPLPVEMLW